MTGKAVKRNTLYPNLHLNPSHERIFELNLNANNDPNDLSLAPTLTLFVDLHSERTSCIHCGFGGVLAPIQGPSAKYTNPECADSGECCHLCEPSVCFSTIEIFISYPHKRDYANIADAVCRIRCKVNIVVAVSQPLPEP